MNLKPGQYVRHAKYGCGTVVTSENDRTTVDFDTVGLKIFVSSLAAFEPAEGEAPKRKRTAAKHRTKAPAL